MRWPRNAMSTHLQVLNLSSNECKHSNLNGWVTRQQEWHANLHVGFLPASPSHKLSPSNEPSEMSEADFKGFQRPIANSQVNAITDGSQSQMAPIHATATERIYSQSDPHSREWISTFPALTITRKTIHADQKKIISPSSWECHTY